jgi:hypothetical protein
MPQKGQMVVTVPQVLYERVRKRVEKGEEKNISSTFIKAVEIYLAKSDPLTEDINWLRDHIAELRKICNMQKNR